MSASLGLYRLQLLDNRMDEIRLRLSEIHQILEDNNEINQAKALVDEANSALELALAALKQAEAEVEKQKVKIEQSEANLYGGKVKNPKELQDIQNEAAALKRYLITLEDRQLDLMLAEESAQKKLHIALQAQKKTRTKLTDQSINLTVEKTELEKELKRLEQERQAVINPLDEDLVSKYDSLRQQLRGLAVADISEGACSACGTTLTPAQQQSARSNSDIYSCPTCGRILYTNE